MTTPQFSAPLCVFRRLAIAQCPLVDGLAGTKNVPLTQADANIGARIRGEARVPPQKILKALFSAQLGIDETSSDALNEMDTDLNSENSSAPGETGGQSQVCESSVARPLGSEAATPAAAADVASGEGSLVPAPGMKAKRRR